MLLLLIISYETLLLPRIAYPCRILQKLEPKDADLSCSLLLLLFTYVNPVWLMVSHPLNDLGQVAYYGIVMNKHEENLRI